MSNELDVQNGWEENTHTHIMTLLFVLLEVFFSPYFFGTVPLFLPVMVLVFEPDFIHIYILSDVRTM